MSQERGNDLADERSDSDAKRANPPQSGPDQLREQLDKEIREAYLYGYDRAKKGLNRRDGFTKEYTDAILDLIAASHNNLIDKLVTELPKKMPAIVMGGRDYAYQEYATSAYDYALKQVKQLLLKYKGGQE